MKNILLLSFFMLFAGMGFSQIKVQTNGYTKVGETNVAALSKLHVEDDVNGVSRVLIDNPNAGALSRSDMYVTTGGPGTGFSVQKLGSNFPGTFGVTPLADAARFIADGSVKSLVFATYNATAPLVLATQGQSRLFIQPGGNVGVGYQTPAHKLHVNGDVVANNVSASSDKRLKKNIQKLEYGLNEVLRMNPVTFQYNGKGEIEDTETTQYGLIAQDMAKILPELVQSYKMTEYSLDLKSIEETNDINVADYAEEKEYLLIRDSQIKFTLINAVKELHGLVELQTELIEAQNEKISQLEEIVKSQVEATNQSNVSLNKIGEAELGQNIPNPFDGQTNIPYVIPSDSNNSEIRFFDIQGKVIKTVSIDHAGEGVINLDALGIPSGSYNYQLLVDGRIVDTKRMILAK